MDIQMPEVDGLSAMREIRKDPKLVNLPIIALTSLAMLGDRETCLEAGATDYLSKPIRLKELVLKIKENFIGIGDKGICTSSDSDLISNQCCTNAYFSTIQRGMKTH